jgi:hypothetical protein
MLQTNDQTANETQTTKRNAEPRIFDIPGSAEYLRELGATGVTAYSVRALIASGQVPHIRVGRRFYVSRASWDSWLAKSERRKHA